MRYTAGKPWEGGWFFLHVGLPSLLDGACPSPGDQGEAHEAVDSSHVDRSSKW